jgi:hypothetical protein
MAAARRLPSPHRAPYRAPPHSPTPWLHSAPSRSAKRRASAAIRARSESRLTPSYRAHSPTPPPADWPQRLRPACPGAPAPGYRPPTCFRPLPATSTPSVHIVPGAAPRARLRPRCWRGCVRHRRSASSGSGRSTRSGWSRGGGPRADRSADRASRSGTTSETDPPPQPRCAP